MSSSEHPAATYIDRIVALETECRGIRLDIREIYDQAKESGFTKGAIRIVVKRSLEDEEQRATREAIETEADQILAALGLLNGRPLSEATQADLELGDEPAPEQPPRRRGRPPKALDASEAEGEPIH